GAIAPQTLEDRAQFELPQVGPSASQQNRFLLDVAKRGDFSNGYHNLMRDTYYDYYRQHGYPVEREVRFNGLADPGISSLVDLMVKTPNDRLAHIEEYKTGKSPTYTPAQAEVF